MAIHAFATFEGVSQGEISSGALSEDSVGTAYQSGMEDYCAVFNIDSEIGRDTDAVSGQINSLPKIKKFELTKQIDKATPLLKNALATGEQLTVTIEYYWISASGEEELFYTEELENAVLTSIKTNMSTTSTAPGESAAPTETLCLRANAVTWSHEPGGTEGQYSFSDGMSA